MANWTPLHDVLVIDSTVRDIPILRTSAKKNVCDKEGDKKENGSSEKLKKDITQGAQKPYQKYFAIQIEKEREYYHNHIMDEEEAKEEYFKTKKTMMDDDEFMMVLEILNDHYYEPDVVHDKNELRESSECSDEWCVTCYKEGLCDKCRKRLEYETKFYSSE